MRIQRSKNPAVAVSTTLVRISRRQRRPTAATTTTTSRFLATGHFSSTSSSSPPPPPVVIVGGGPVGLFLSHLLHHSFAIPHVLLEQQPVRDCFRHPQAHFLNTRTMELIRHCLPPPLSWQMAQAMPPVQQWQNFVFGTCMDVHDDDNPPLAVVRHPVDRPLQVASDANGVLLSSPTTTTNDCGSDWFQHRENNHNHNPCSFTPSWSDLSPCSVGHLAQHTFGRILYEAAEHGTDPHTRQLRYGTRVEHIHLPTTATTTNNNDSNSKTTRTTTTTTTSSSSNNGLIQVTTAEGTVYETDWLVAADGAHSRVRSQLLQIAPEGRPDALQHLMNLHVTLPPNVAAEIFHNNNNNTNHAMLYSVYNERVVAMVVCHSVGEYVVQIPFFPPYQTPHEDFGPAQWPHLLSAIFGSRAAPYCRVQSARPWTMTSWVARHYGWVSNNNHNKNTTNAAVVLVGDAAHVFPPAGGFGMNTGLQDAHNLACKIATHRYRCYYNTTTNASHPTTTTSARSSDLLQSLVLSYERERQPIARQNAALSLRNYQRLLRVTRQLYLNDQHPALLQTVLDRSAGILPLTVRQATFRSLLETALYPLRWLKHNHHHHHSTHHPHNSSSSSSSYYRNHIQSNLRHILQSGAGLPLLFPKFEIGYTYDCMQTTEQQSPDYPLDPDRPDDNHNNDWSGDADTWAAPPQLCVGGLVPHVAVVVVSPAAVFPRLRPLPPNHNNNSTTTTMISTTDLPAQMARSTAPCYVLLWVVMNNNNKNNNQCAKDLTVAVSCARERAQGLPVEVAVLWPSPSSSTNNDGHDDESCSCTGTTTPVTPTTTLLHPPGSSLSSFSSEWLLLTEPPRPEPAFSWARGGGGRNGAASSYGVLIRPDGHMEQLIHHHDGA